MPAAAQRPDAVSMQVRIMHGVLDRADKTAVDAMIPIDRVFMLDIERQLDQALIEARPSRPPGGRWRPPGRRLPAAPCACGHTAQLRRHCALGKAPSDAAPRRAGPQ